MSSCQWASVRCSRNVSLWVGKDGVYIRVTYIYGYCIARIHYSTRLLGWPENCAALVDDIFNSGECTEILEQQIVAMNGTSNLCQKRINLKFLRLIQHVQSSLHHSCIICHHCLGGAGQLQLTNHLPSIVNALCDVVCIFHLFARVVCLHKK